MLHILQGKSFLTWDATKNEYFTLDLAPETPLLFSALLNLELVLYTDLFWYKTRRR